MSVFLLSQISTWIFVEIVATSILTFLNLIIPMLLFFSSYRNLINFYFSSIALSSSLINSLYLFYLIQMVRIKTLSENNCRAIYYLQTCAVLVLAYTIVGMHAHFIINLFPSAKQLPNPTLYQSCQLCLRRLFRRFCFCSVVLFWAFSFISVIPLLYTIDSNEKTPKPVYCPGIREIHYLQEWFDLSRPIQTMLFHFLPFLINIILFLIALGKLTFECSIYMFFKFRRISKCFPCRTNLFPESFHHFFLKSFFRCVFILSTCLLACLYPIVMRFYMIYFSAFIPLIFVIFNYTLADLHHSTELPTTPVIQNENLGVSTRKATFSNEISLATIPEQIELQPSIANLLPGENDQRKSSFTNYLYENTRNLK